MNLATGIHIKSPYPTKEYIKINSGSKLISGKYNFFEDMNFEYFDHSYIPKDDWRNLNVSEYNLLANNIEINNRNFIKIDYIPTNIVDLIHKLSLNNLNSRSEIFSNFENNIDIVDELNKKLENFIYSISENLNYEFYKLVVFPKKVITSGISNDEITGERKFLGLHIDRSTHFNIENASNSKNRICFNIGDEERELYLINLSLSQIKAKLAEKGYNDIDIDTNNITDLFFKEFIDYPVLKIKIKPYQYYIAPTDNYIHDGTTINKDKLDITLTYLGYFKL